MIEGNPKPLSFGPNVSRYLPFWIWECGGDDPYDRIYVFFGDANDRPSEPTAYIQVPVAGVSHWWYDRPRAFYQGAIAWAPTPKWASAYE